MKVRVVVVCVVAAGVVGAGLAGAPASAAEALSRREMPLERYGHRRTVFRPGEVEYLLGNAELGGLSDNRGLGFDKLWATDLWENHLWRESLPGPLLLDADQKGDFAPASFRHDLSIRDGIQSTEVQFPDGRGYATRIFFSKRDRHLLVLRVANRSRRPGDMRWELRLPTEGFTVESPDGRTLRGQSTDPALYTRIAWALASDKPLVRDGQATHLVLKAGEATTLLYALTTSWDGEDYRQQAARAVSRRERFESLEREQRAAWDEQWRSIASVILPEGEYAKWFYRSLALLYWTSGAENFCAGEEQFSAPDSDWRMHPFTYGHGGGWSVWAFASLGDRERAMRIARWHYRPEALRENVRILFPRTGPVPVTYRGKDKGTHTYLTEHNPDAIAFGHEVDTNRHNVTYEGDKHWDWQRHIDGYAAAFYHLLDRYYPDPAFTSEVTYPVLRGTAELYRSLAKRDEAGGFYYLPPLLSVSENLMERSVLDAVLAARWTLNMAARYADRLQTDRELATRWREVAAGLRIPQNDSVYLEHLDDTQSRPGGGYFGIRAFQYFGFPFLEQIRDLDREKMRRALDLAWTRNRQGEGMITFILNWFALTESYLGYGQRAYELSRIMTAIQDPSGTCLVEAISKDEQGRPKHITPYFLTGNSSFVLVPLSMAHQAYDDRIRVFPAMPAELGEIELHDLPTIGGLTLSGRYRRGGVSRLAIRRKGRVVWEREGRAPFSVGFDELGPVAMPPAVQR